MECGFNRKYLNLSMVVRFIKEEEKYYVEITYSNSHNKQNRIIFNNDNFELNWYLAVKTIIRLDASPIYDGTELISDLLTNLNLKLYYLIDFEGEFILTETLPANDEFLIFFSDGSKTFAELSEEYKDGNYNPHILNWDTYSDIEGLPGIKERKITIKNEK
jgi:hypothetical protein